MKKIVSLMLAFILLFSLAACSSTDVEEVESEVDLVEIASKNIAGTYYHYHTSSAYEGFYDDVRYIFNDDGTGEIREYFDDPINPDVTGFNYELSESDNAYGVLVTLSTGEDLTAYVDADNNKVTVIRTNDGDEDGKFLQRTEEENQMVFEQHMKLFAGDDIHAYALYFHLGEYQKLSDDEFKELVIGNDFYNICSGKTYVYRFVDDSNVSKCIIDKYNTDEETWEIERKWDIVDGDFKTSATSDSSNLYSNGIAYLMTDGQILLLDYDNSGNINCEILSRSDVYLGDDKVYHTYSGDDKESSSNGKMSYSRGSDWENYDADNDGYIDGDEFQKGFNDTINKYLNGTK